MSMSDITSLLIWLTEKQFSNIVFGYEKGYHYFLNFSAEVVKVTYYMY